MGQNIMYQKIWLSYILIKISNIGLIKRWTIIGWVRYIEKLFFPKFLIILKTAISELILSEILSLKYFKYYITFHFFQQIVYLCFTEGWASAVVYFGHYFRTKFEAGYKILTFCFRQYSGVGWFKFIHFIYVFFRQLTAYGLWKLRYFIG